MDDNNDAVERRILSTLSQLLEVESALDDWAASNAEEPRGIREFKRCLMSLYFERTLASNDGLGPSRKNWRS